MRETDLPQAGIPDSQRYSAKTTVVIMAVAAIASAAPSERLLLDIAVSRGNFKRPTVYNLMKNLTNYYCAFSGKVAPVVQWQRAGSPTGGNF